MDRAEALKFAEEVRDKHSYRLECAVRVPARSYYEKVWEMLNYAIAALREQEQSKWISVNERLPEKSGEYLVVSEKGNHVNVLDYSAVHKAFNADDDFDDAQYAVSCTHWMPLPEPPKEGA